MKSRFQNYLGGLALMFLLSGCGGLPERSPTLENGSATSVAGGLLMTEPGSVVTQTLEVTVDEPGGTVRVFNRALSGATYIAPKDWSAGPGWFVFIESNRRLWAYDGALKLLKFETTRDWNKAGLNLYYLDGSGEELPAAVSSRLSPAARQRFGAR